MVLPCFLAAPRLRAQFDPEYLDGSLGYTPLADLETAPPEPWSILRYRRDTEQASADYPAMVEVLRATRPSLLAPEQAEPLRAVRIAMHVNRGGLRRLVRRFAKQPSLRDRTLAQATPIIDQAAHEKSRYSRLLVGLRVHHELTRLHHAGYLGLFETLYHSCEK